MGIEVRLDTSGLDRIIRYLPKEANNALHQVASSVETYAKESVPIDTGQLYHSISFSHHDEAKFEAIVEVDQDYAAAVEYGTGRTRARPYLTPAVEQATGELDTALVRLFNRLKGSE